MRTRKRGLEPKDMAVAGLNRSTVSGIPEERPRCIRTQGLGDTADTETVLVPG